jgi:hypothetical protein
MSALLSDFRSELRDHLLDTVWQQWTSAGLSGRVDAGSESVVDPEALLLFTCTIGRHDQRLLDGALEWLDANGDFINVQRLNRIAEEERFSGKAVLRALAAVTRTSKSQAKWSALADAHPGPNVESEPLFYRRSGGALPVVREPDPVFAGYGLIRDAFERRGLAGGFRPESTANLILRLRAFLGVNARCEILSYLLLNHAGSPRAVASDCYFFPATVSKAMAEMGRSGFLVSRTEGRRKLYQLFPDGWSHLFFADDARPPWVVWPRVFSALERVWLLVSDPQLAEKPAAEQASALRRLLVDGVIDQFERGRPGFAFGDIGAHTGEALTPFFISRLRSLLAMSP